MADTESGRRVFRVRSGRQTRLPGPGGTYTGPTRLRKRNGRSRGGRTCLLRDVLNWKVPCFVTFRTLWWTSDLSGPLSQTPKCLSRNPGTKPYHRNLELHGTVSHSRSFPFDPFRRLSSVLTCELPSVLILVATLQPFDDCLVVGVKISRGLWGHEGKRVEGFDGGLGYIETGPVTHRFFPFGLQTLSSHP